MTPWHFLINLINSTVPRTLLHDQVGTFQIVFNFSSGRPPGWGILRVLPFFKLLLRYPLCWHTLMILFGLRILPKHQPGLHIFTASSILEALIEAPDTITATCVPGQSDKLGFVYTYMVFSWLVTYVTDTLALDLVTKSHDHSGLWPRLPQCILKGAAFRSAKHVAESTHHIQVDYAR